MINISNLKASVVIWQVKLIFLGAKWQVTLKLLITQTAYLVLSMNSNLNFAPILNFTYIITNQLSDIVNSANQHAIIKNGKKIGIFSGISFIKKVRFFLDIFYEKSPCPPFVGSKKVHAHSFCRTKKSPYPVIFFLKKSSCPSFFSNKKVLAPSFFMAKKSSCPPVVLPGRVPR